MPIGFTLLDKFHSRRLLLGESLSLFSHELKKLLKHAMHARDRPKNARSATVTSVRCGSINASQQIVAGGWSNRRTKVAMYA